MAECVRVDLDSGQTSNSWPTPGKDHQIALQRRDNVEVMEAADGELTANARRICRRTSGRDKADHHPYGAYGSRPFCYLIARKPWPQHQTAAPPTALLLACSRSTRSQSRLLFTCAASAVTSGICSASHVALARGSGSTAHDAALG